MKVSPDINWFENPQGVLRPGVVRAELVRVGLGQRASLRSGMRVSTVTLTFDCTRLGLRLRKTFTRSFLPGSKLLRFLAAMAGRGGSELNNPFAARRLLLSQLRRRFVLECVALDHGHFLDIKRALPESAGCVDAARRPWRA